MNAKHLELVKESELMKTLPEETIKSFIKNNKLIIKQYKKGCIIHMEDDLCDKVEVILSGKVVIDSLDEAGNLLSLTDFQKDDILGGSLIFASDPHYPMTISSLSDSSLLQISKKVLIELFDIKKDFFITFLQLISDNTTILSRKIKHGINKSIREKLFIYLSRQQKAQKTSDITLKMSKKKMAEKMGVQRTSLSRELAKMKDDGYIDYDRDKIYIINLDKNKGQKQ